MSKVLDKLKKGDLRTTGKSDEVIKDVLKNPKLFGELFRGMLSDNPGLRMRAADAAEKISAKKPELLQPFKSKLINKVSKIEQQEVQWHVSQMLSYLKLSKSEISKVIKILNKYIDTTKSNIVKVFSIQTLAELAEKDYSIKRKVVKKIKELMKSGTPSIMSRGRKLLKKLE